VEHLSKRLAVLRDARLLETPPEPDFDAHARLAAAVLKTPVGLVVFVDEHRQVLKGVAGLEEPWASRRETPLSHSFCIHAVESGETLAVDDARTHPLLRHNPAIEEMGVTAYLGVPLHFRDHAIGTVCVHDRQPRRWTEAEIGLLSDVARGVTATIELRVALRVASDERALFAAVLESVADGVLAIDTQRAFRVVNAAARELFGVTFGPGLTLPTDWAVVRNVANPDGTPLPSGDGVLTRSVLGESTEKRTFAMTHAGKGTRVWVEASGRPVRSASGEVTAGVAVYRDVTGRGTRAQQFLDAQELLMRTGQLAKVGGWQLELATRKLAWSEEVYRLHEVSPDIGPVVEDAISFYAPEARPIIQAAVERGISHGESWDLELPFVTAKGRRLWVRAQGEAVRENGKVTRLVGAFQDITERKHAELSLVGERAFLETLLENLPDIAVVLFDEDARVVRVHGSSPFVGPAPSTHVGRPFAELAPSASRAELEAAARACIAQRKRATVDVTTPAGRRLEVGIAPLVSAASEARSGLAVAVDVTEREHARMRLALQERLVAMGALASGVGHEINNPLTYLTTNMEVLREELTSRPIPSMSKAELIEVVEDAVDGTERIRRIVADLRAFTREAASPVPIDVLEIVAAAARLMAHELRSQAALVTRLDAAPRILGDPARLGQIVVNLVVNAGQAFGDRRREENEIVVATGTDGEGRCVIEVRDNGGGMDPATSARVFHPFFARPTGVEHSGLGLALCQSAVVGLGGDITCTSAVGRGTTFRVVLPAAQLAPAVAAAPVSRLSVHAKRGRVILIDDEIALTAALQRALASAHDVRAFNDPREALDTILGGAACDVVLCDVMMPHLSGRAFFERLRAARPELARRVVFLTGGILDKDLDDFLARLPNERLSKPLSLSFLREVVWRLVSEKSEYD
jgi:signal transduction histidine kinase/PAS domain-containing protein/CheY-like chemotaxis protein